jgi:hypothetical protein
MGSGMNEGSLDRIAELRYFTMKQKCGLERLKSLMQALVVAATCLLFVGGAVPKEAREAKRKCQTLSAGTSLSP